MEGMNQPNYVSNTVEFGGGAICKEGNYEIGNLGVNLDWMVSVINVSVQTVEIVKGLPGFRFD